MSEFVKRTGQATADTPPNKLEDRSVGPIAKLRDWIQKRRVLNDEYRLLHIRSRDILPISPSLEPFAQEMRKFIKDMHNQKCVIVADSGGTERWLVSNKAVFQGGMGEIHLGYDPKLKMFIILKTMNTELADYFFSETLKKEAKLLAKVTHPHIVFPYDLTEYRHMPAIIMPLINPLTTVPLHELIEKHHVQRQDEFNTEDTVTYDLDTHTICMIITQLAQVIRYLCNKRMPNFDLKPSHVFITKQGIQLIDFGVSPAILKAGIGTPHYFSPERARIALMTESQRKQALTTMLERDGGELSEIYSLGTIIYYMFAGKTLHSTDRFHEAVILNVSTYQFDINDQQHIQLRAKLRHEGINITTFGEILGKALANKPEERYSDVTLFAQDLIACLKG